MAALQTEAVLDVTTDEWVVHTPTDAAIKARLLVSDLSGSSFLSEPIVSYKS